MVETLLQHLETEKGDQGLYMTNRQAAFREVKELLAKSSQSNPVSVTQVENKVEKLFQRFHDKEHTNFKSFFSLGRLVLKPPYNRRPSVSSSEDNDEWTLSDHPSSSDEESAKRSPRRPARKRRPLKAPTSPSRKNSK